MNNYKILNNPWLSKKQRQKFEIFLKETLEFNYPYSKRKIYERSCKILNLNTYLIRKYLGQKLIKDQPYQFWQEIDKNQGFLISHPQNLSVFAEALTFAKQRLEQANVSELLTKAEGKHRYLLAIPIKNELHLEHPLMKLACHRELLKVVTEYIGILPILNSVNLLYSPNQNIFEHSSQFLHFTDPEGIRQIKIFIYLDEVTNTGGPFTLVPAQESRKVYPYYRGGRLSDEFFSQYVDLKNFQPVTGPAGTMALVDTSSCFHFGSRPGDKDRPVLLIQYVSPFAMIFPRFGTQRTARLAHLVDENTPVLEQYLLGAK